MNYNSLTILFWLVSSRQKNGLCPIYCRITLNGKRAEINTSKSADPKSWDKIAQKILSKSETAKDINFHLDTIKGSINKHFSLLVASDRPISAEILKNQFMGFKPKEKQVIETFEYYLKRFNEKVSSGKRNTHTLTRLTISKGKLIKYLKDQYRVSDIPLSQLKLANASGYCHYLETKEKLSTNTAMKHVKNFKQVIRFAIEQGWIEIDPLMSFKCTYQDPERERLTMEELSTIYKKEFSIKRVEEVRDVFIFSCYTGYAYVDAYELTPDNLIIGIDSEKWLSKARNKTEAPETVPLLPIALEIIEKYKGDPYCMANNKLLPVNSNQKYNAYLKEIADLCNIKKHLTTHTARHTFATTVTLENDVPIETVSQMLGHKSILTTQIYAKITQKKMSNNMKELRKKLFPVKPEDQNLLKAQ